MENQMRMFEEGGIADDGMTRDPVSGNEIPPGSMAEEVRDDVPAQLSEGEYVVPADVVRFFGVKFFEDLRMTAKQGLQQMEQDGRIGGEPTTSPAPEPEGEDLSPEEEALLQEIMAMEQQPQQQVMAEGGVVNAAYGISVGSGDPLTEDITVSTGDRSGTSTGTGMRSVFFIHPDGRRIKVLMLDDTPIGKVPDDFDTFTSDTPENRIKINFKDTTGDTGSGVGTASGVDSAGGGGAGVGKDSVAVGESYTTPSGETKTRMTDEYYMGGGDSDQAEALTKLGSGKAPEKTIEGTGINYQDPVAGATDALSAGRNELVQYGAGLFPLLGVINSGAQAIAISQANANAIIALRKGDKEQHTAILKQIKEYENQHSSLLADAGTWFAGLFVDAGQNRVDDWDELTEGGLYPDGKTSGKIPEGALTKAQIAKKRRAEANALRIEEEKFAASLEEEAKRKREEKRELALREATAAKAEAIRLAGGAGGRNTGSGGIGSTVSSTGQGVAPGGGQGTGYGGQTSTGGQMTTPKYGGSGGGGGGGNSTNPRTKSKNYDNRGNYTGPAGTYRGGLIDRPKKTKKKK